MALTGLISLPLWLLVANSTREADNDRLLRAADTAHVLPTSIVTRSLAPSPAASSSGSAPAPPPLSSTPSSPKLAVSPSPTIGDEEETSRRAAKFSTFPPPPTAPTRSRPGGGELRPTSTPRYPPVPALLDRDSDVAAALKTKLHADGTEQLLYQTLLDERRYEKDVRPVAGEVFDSADSTPINVTFGFLLNQIVEMDERNQVLTTRSWLNVNWMDRRLSWNKTLWGGISTLYIPHRRIWKPDIFLVNNAIKDYHEALVSTDIMTTSDGNVTWLFSAIFKSSCRIKVRYYPFDDQECELRFAAWSHDGAEIQLGVTTSEGDLSSYMNNSEFDLMHMTAQKEMMTFPSDNRTPWPVIVIRILLHRRPLFYVFNHILPCVLISSMAVLGFLMPPETGEKINMIITTLLSMGVYLQSITESIPPTSEAVPLIGMYYVSSLFMVCLATCVNVVTVNLHRNGDSCQGRRVPKWMRRWILGCLASLLRISIREPDGHTLLANASAGRGSIRFGDWRGRRRRKSGERGRSPSLRLDEDASGSDVDETGMCRCVEWAAKRAKVSAGSLTEYMANNNNNNNYPTSRNNGGSDRKSRPIIINNNNNNNSSSGKNVGCPATTNGRLLAQSCGEVPDRPPLAYIDEYGSDCPTSPGATRPAAAPTRYNCHYYGNPRLHASRLIGVENQILPRLSCRARPRELAEFEVRFRRILKHIFRALQKHEIREEVVDERARVQWQWRHLATVVDRLLLVLFTLATVGTLLCFLVLPVTLKDHFGWELIF